MEMRLYNLAMIINEPGKKDPITLMCHIEVPYKTPDHEIQRFIRSCMEQYSAEEKKSMEETVDWLLTQCEKKYGGEAFVTQPHSIVYFSAEQKESISTDMHHLFN